MKLDQKNYKIGKTSNLLNRMKTLQASNPNFDERDFCFPTGEIIMSVYLLHFSRPYKHAKHYIGWADQLEQRIEHHKNGTGARLTQVVVQAGIDLILARVWDGKDKSFERHLKNQHKPQAFCPVCNPEKANNNMKG